jgi:hypothetical protein
MLNLLQSAIFSVPCKFMRLRREVYNVPVPNMGTLSCGNIFNFFLLKMDAA